FTIHGLSQGDYAIEARFVGYHAARRPVHIAGDADVRMDFRMVGAPLNLAAIEVTASAPVAVDTRTGDETFKMEQYHGAPTNTTSQIVQQSIAGAARAPTGEVHIRGQHAEYTYYVDGVPVPSGISGSLNELFDPQVVNQIDFQTGGWDAEYGNKNTAIVNVNTRIPSGGFHMDVSGLGGSFREGFPAQSQYSNGQTLTLSTNAGKWGLFASGAPQETDMRREPVVFDTARKAVENFHNDGSDIFRFAKVQYVPT